MCVFVTAMSAWNTSFVSFEHTKHCVNWTDLITITITMFMFNVCGHLILPCVFICSFAMIERKRMRLLLVSVRHADVAFNMIIVKLCFCVRHGMDLVKTCAHIHNRWRWVRCLQIWHIPKCMQRNCLSIWCWTVNEAFRTHEMRNSHSSFLIKLPLRFGSLSHIIHLFSSSFLSLHLKAITQLCIRIKRFD